MSEPNSMLPCQRRPNKSAIASAHVIERYAVDNKGKVGCLYDAWIDHMSFTSVLGKNFITVVDIADNAQCEVINSDELDEDDLLKIVHIDGDLWVSIALGMASVTGGIRMLYNYKLPFDRNVSFLYYRRIDHHVHLSGNIDDIRNVLDESLKSIKATHIITDVKQGIDFVIAIEFSKSEDSNAMKSILRKVCGYFKEKGTDFLHLEEQEVLNRCTSEVFTHNVEMHRSIDKKNLSEICEIIHRYILEFEPDYPLYYTLHPVRCFFSDNSNVGGTFVPLEPFIREKIETVTLQLFNKLKPIQYLSDEIGSLQLSQYLKTRYDHSLEQLDQINNAYNDIRNQLAERVLKLRRGTDDNSSFNRDIEDIDPDALDRELDSLQEILLRLKCKARSIVELKTKYGLEYFDVFESEEEDDDQRALDTKILSFYYEQPVYIICSSEELMKNNTTQFDELRQQLMKEKEKNPSLRLVFADFSHCLFELPNMKLLPANFESPISTVPKTSAIDSNELNILLLGETGIGKSTFINAFANYLAFKSMDKAEKDGPIVIIPASFLMTSNDQYDEHEVKLGESNHSNEDFDHSGQTITQYCESYIFNLDNETKLRIIDTPGIGDTRGLSQDDKNIQYILSYVNNLSHLNAICILLKPNTTRLHALFRLCFDQIFNFLGPNARENILFCFTNSRSSFYLPGNTTSLLRKMLNDLPADHAPPLNKTNMFCFDSEAFRYLAATKAQVSIQFKEDQKAEFGTSWSKSVSESIRLINSLKLCPKYQMNTCLSIKHAQIMITSLIRPILETIRNTLRNMILQECKNKRYSIELSAQPVEQSSFICTGCVHEIKQTEDFPCVMHSAHHYQKSGVCDTCQCEYNQHFPILYELHYESNTIKNPGIHSKLEEMQARLLQGSAVFAHFLLQTVRVGEDPFLFWLELFIREELHLCSQTSSNILNTVLHMRLLELKDAYQRQLDQSKQDQEQINIDAIYNWLVAMQDFPEIDKQMNAIKESQMKIMKKHEHNISSQYPQINMSNLLTDPVTEND